MVLTLLFLLSPLIGSSCLAETKLKNTLILHLPLPWCTQSNLCKTQAHCCHAVNALRMFIFRQRGGFPFPPNPAFPNKQPGKRREDTTGGPGGALHLGGKAFEQVELLLQARKTRSYASPKLQPTD